MTGAKTRSEPTGRHVDVVGAGIGLGTAVGGTGVGTLIGLLCSGWSGGTDGATLGGLFGLCIALYITAVRIKSGILGTPGRPPRVGDFVDGWRVISVRGRDGYLLEVADGRHRHGMMKTVDLARGMADMEAAQRLVRETELLREVNSPYVVSVLDAGRVKDHFYLVTQFVSGGDLQRAVDGSGALSGEALFQIARGSARAVAALHAAGIVHRDLKPANILVRNGQPILCDLGIASSRAAYRLTRTGAVLGTADYMSPEQTSGTDALDAPSDVFSWAATMFFAATGAQPFAAHTEAAILERVRTAQADLARCPPWLAQILGDCLAKSPAARPTAAELCRSLDRAAARTSWSDRHPDLPLAAPKATRPPAWVPAALMLGFVGALVIAVSTWNAGPARSNSGPQGQAESTIPVVPLSTSPPAPSTATPSAAPGTPSPAPSTPSPIATTQPPLPTPTTASTTPTPSQAPGWPVTADDGSIAMNEYFGSEFYVPQWTSCDPSTYCITSDGGAEVYVYTQHPINRVKEFSANVPSPYDQLRANGFSAQEADVLLKIDS